MYDTAVKLAREQIDSILERTWLALQSVDLGEYSKLEWSELKPRLLPGLHKHLEYLETGDLTAWKDYSIHVIESRMTRGLDYTRMIAMNQLLLKAVQGFFEETLPPLGTIDGRPADRVVRLLTNRLAGLDSVGSLTATATALKLSRELIKTQ